MKVLLINLWPGPPMQYTVATYKGLKKYNRADTEVNLLITHNEQISLLDDTDGVNVVRLAIPEKYSLITYILFLFQFPAAFYRVRKKIRQLKPDVIHILFNHPLLLLVLETLPEISVVATLHDPIPHKGQPTIDRLWNRWEILKSKLVFVHSTYNQLLAREYVFKKKVIDIALGNITNVADTTDLKSFETSYILFFGRVTPYKGIDILLRAMTIVWKIQPEIRLVIAGGGSLESYNKKILSDGRIRVLNRYIDNNEMGALFAGSRFVVLPYIEATQSGVISTAAAFSRAVIASDVGGIGEIVSDQVTGLLIKSNSPDILASAIVRLWLNPAWARKMGCNAYDYLQTNCSWQKICSDLLDGYRMAWKEYR